MLADTLGGFVGLGITLAITVSLVTLGLGNQGGLSGSVQTLLETNRDRRPHRAACDSDLDTPTFRRYGDGYGLTREHMAWYWSMYAPNPATRHFADLTPLNAPNLSELPPAMIITAECDVLRDEAERYTARLLAAGNTVLHRTYAGQIHGFLGNDTSPDGTDALAWIARGLDLLAGDTAG